MCLARRDFLTMVVDLANKTHVISQKHPLVVLTGIVEYISLFLPTASQCIKVELEAAEDINITLAVHAVAGVVCMVLESSEPEHMADAFRKIKQSRVLDYLAKGVIAKPLLKPVYMLIGLLSWMHALALDTSNTVKADALVSLVLDSPCVHYAITTIMVAQIDRLVKNGGHGLAVKIPKITDPMLLQCFVDLVLLCWNTQIRRGEGGGKTTKKAKEPLFISCAQIRVLTAQAYSSSLQLKPTA
jgi:hypothetical protein